MAEYVPTIWECGDVVTAERLNHMEEGIADAIDCCNEGGESEPLVVRGVVMTAEEIAEVGITGTENSDVYRLDATSDAIEAAYASGRAVHLVDNGAILSLVVMNTSDNLRGFGFIASVNRSSGVVSGVMWPEIPGYAYPVRIVGQSSEE